MFMYFRTALLGISLLFFTAVQSAAHATASDTRVVADPASRPRPGFPPASCSLESSADQSKHLAY